MPKNIDVIIPIFNEAFNLTELVKRLHLIFKNLDIKYRLIFVDDNSTDDSLKILHHLSTKYPITAVLKHGPKGKAASIFQGVDLAKSEYVIMIDGDLQYPPEAIPAMLDQTPQQGLIIAERKVRHTSAWRSLISRANRFIFGRLLLGLNYDTQSGLKVFRREILSHLNRTQVSSWAIDVPLITTALNLGYTIGSVDIDFAERKSGTSKVNFFKASWQISKSAINSRVRSCPVYPIDADTSANSVGAGLVHNRKRYVTHSRLPSHLSAVRTFESWQRNLVLIVALILLAGLLINPGLTVILFLGVLSFLYLLDVLFNFFIIYKSLHFPPEYTFSDTELTGLNSKNLPLYTVMVPMYREAKILPNLLTSLSKLDWPKDKLEVLLLLEADDAETIAAANTSGVPDYVRALIVPPSSPKTKPKACNYGLQHARGEYIVIYDAEDVPDPQQLKKAYLGFQKAPANTACLQGKLNYFNPRDNLLTRFFTAEYSLWFDVILPGLQSINTTIPLGGTSNHFRTQILKDLHGWDAFNVTEDCDLGARMFKNGYQTAIIDSTTLEEANSHVGNWIRQRSRWIKGYLQTFLVHNRHPLKFLRQHGRHALIFQLIIGMRISFMIINPLLWATTIAYFAAYRFVGPAIESVYPAPVFYMAAFAAIIGNFLFLFNYMIGCAKKGHWNLIKYVYMIPVYWLMISLAAVKAFYQLLVKPYYWEKTLHGITKSQAQNKSVRLAFSFPDFSWVRFPKPWKILSSQVRSAGVLVVASMLINVINFVYTSYLSHSQAISLSQFGLISLIGSILTIFQIPQSALSKTVTYRSGYLTGKYDFSPVNFWSYVRRKSYVISAVILFFWLIITPFLPRLFGSDSIFPFLLFSPMLIISTLGAVDSGFLGGIGKFGVLAVMYMIEAVSKLLITVVLVSLGLTQLVYLAIPLSAFAALCIGWLVIKRIKTSPRPEVDTTSLHYFPKRFFNNSILSRLSGLSFMSLDIILAKLYLTPEQAGEYALISTIGKMVYFAGTTFSQFIVPLVSIEEGAGRNSSRLFYRLLAITGLVTAVSATLLGLLGQFTAPLLLGEKAIAIASYLPLYTFAVSFFTIASAIVYYHQIKKQYLFGYVAFVLGLVQAVALSRVDQDLNLFVEIMFGISFLFNATAFILHFSYSRLLSLIGRFFRSGSKVIPDAEKPLRILIFNWRDTKHVWAGGAEVYVHELAKRWVKMRHQVTIFCGNDKKNLPHEYVDGVEIYRRGGFFMVYFWAPIYYLFKFRGKYDVIVDSENGIPFFTPLFSRIPKLLLIHHVHQNVFREHLKFPLSHLAIFLEGKLMPLVYSNHQIITVSASSKADILNMGLSTPERINIVSPGIDLSHFRPGKKTPYPSFLYLGRIRPYKNVDIAIRSFQEVVNQYPRAKLYIAGWGENLKELKYIAEKLNLEKSVIFLGKVSEKDKLILLKRSWVMLQPSSFEGWGITVIEANACGTPVIASDVSGLRDSVVDGKTGLLTKLKDINQLSGLIASLIKNYSYRKALSQNAKEWSREFGWDKQSELFLSLIAELAAEKQNRVIYEAPAYEFKDA